MSLMTFGSIFELAGQRIRAVARDTVILGSGAAGLNAADCLFNHDYQDFCIVTDNIKGGSSRNSGSDKQTYYKLGMTGDRPDSVQELAETFYSGGSVDGDNALCEAAMSAECFFNLVRLGVEFPYNDYGEYVSYITDHDPGGRATSAGPYTSRRMTEVLEDSVLSKHIEIHDHLRAVKIINKTDQNKIWLVCFNQNAEKEGECLTLFVCNHLIIATGGPASIYADVVYPEGQFGASGLAFEAGVKGANLTEWQYGLASINPRWNVSGTYMQCLPRFISTLPDGTDEREFLLDYYADCYEMCNNIFLKGYQWPFDVKKMKKGSSRIDQLVYQETKVKGRRVFLDFMNNPGLKSIDINRLNEKAKMYLNKAGAHQATPIERLKHMNEPAVNLYLDKGVDLSTEKLEIRLCAQHNNGGLCVNRWWQTNVPGIFAVGEAAGTHGVIRPGGASLNAGQVGSRRAAQWISQTDAVETEINLDSFRNDPELGQFVELISKTKNSISNVEGLLKSVKTKMSAYAGPFRQFEGMQVLLDEVNQLNNNFSSAVTYTDVRELEAVFRLREILISQKVYLAAMIDYVASGGKSRGGALYDSIIEADQAKEKPHNADQGTNLIQELRWGREECQVEWRPVRPIPARQESFETVWRKFRESKARNVFC